MAALSVICDLWPNPAQGGGTKAIRQQFAGSAKQKPPLLMKQKACGFPANPQELPNAAQTKPEIKRSQRQAHFCNRAKVFLFHGLGGFPLWGSNRIEKINAFPLSVTDFERAGFSYFFLMASLHSHLLQCSVGSF